MLGPMASLQWALVCNLLREEQLVTKKDYVMIAALFHEARSEGYTLNQTIELFGEMFADNNDRFDYERFVAACKKK